ncbi:MAG: sel1 repeat family protein [Moraxellaceae bacterium]|nr:sel1 repeat family protein [Moraxellaceae bacterium]
MLRRARIEKPSRPGTPGFAAGRTPPRTDVCAMASAAARLPDLPAACASRTRGLFLTRLLCLACLLPALAGAADLAAANRHLEAREYAAAERAYRELAQQGEAGAFYGLGVLYANGFGVKQDMAAAHHWFEKAAQGGHPDAMVKTGMGYVTGIGPAQNVEKGLPWLRKAAERGSPEGQFLLAIIEAKGVAGPPDMARVRALLEQSAVQGHAQAQGVLGLMFLDGSGGERDLKQAQYWLLRAAEGGDLSAANHLGMLYTNGAPGWLPDLAMARHWFGVAADLGGMNAAYNLARMLQKGEGGPRDDNAAYQRFEQAAELGHAEAQYLMGQRAERGAVKTARLIALHWYRKAAAQGHEAAAVRLREIERMEALRHRGPLDFGIWP